MAEKHEKNTRYELLMHSRRMLVEEGYNAFSMRKLAQKAGCATGTIYLYYNNKDDLIHALIDEGFESLYAKLSEDMELRLAPVNKLETICRSYIRFGLENQEYYEIMFMLHPERMRRYPRDKFRKARRSVNLVCRVLEKISGHAGHNEQDIVTAAYGLWSAMHGAVSILIARRLDTQIDRETFIKKVIRKSVRAATMPDIIPEEKF